VDSFPGEPIIQYRFRQKLSGGKTCQLRYLMFLDLGSIRNSDAAVVPKVMQALCPGYPTWKSSLGWQHIAGFIISTNVVQANLTAALAPKVSGEFSTWLRKKPLSPTVSPGTGEVGGGSSVGTQAYAGGAPGTIPQRLGRYPEKQKRLLRDDAR